MSDNEKQSDMKWYVVRAATGYEDRVVASIRLLIENQNIQESFGQIIVPSEEIIEMRAGVKRKTRRKHFPGYVLVEMVMCDDLWHKIRKLQHVLGFIGGRKGQPTPISTREANEILDRMNDDVSVAKPKVVFVLGQMVRVIDGPFNDFNGVVEDVNYEKSRLVVSVLIFGRATPVELEFNQVEKSS